MTTFRKYLFVAALAVSSSFSVATAHAFDFLSQGPQTPYYDVGTVNENVRECLTDDQCRESVMWEHMALLECNVKHKSAKENAVVSSAAGKIMSKFPHDYAEQSDAFFRLQKRMGSNTLCRSIRNKF